MTENKKLVIDCQTGTETIEDITAQEQELFELGNAEVFKVISEQNEKEEIQTGLIESARVKLLALGLTEEEAEAIVGPEPKVIDEDVTNLDPVTMEPAPAERNQQEDGRGDL